MSKASSAVVPAIVATVVVSASTLFIWKHIKKSVTGAVTVSELNVYPVKSCAEVTLDTATPTPRGFEGDRIAQVTDKNGKYCTPRDKDKVKLFQIQPEIWGSGLTFQSPSCDEPLEIDLATAKTTPVKVSEACRLRILSMALYFSLIIPYLPGGSLGGAREAYSSGLRK